VGKPSNYREINNKCDPWWTHACKAYKGKKLIKAAIERPMWAGHPNVEKLMINATYDGPIWTSHPKVEN